MPPLSSRWLLPLEASGTTRLRLFCFPYAGGGAAAYRCWREQLPPEIALILVQLPGRESRLTDPPFVRMASLIEELAEVMCTQRRDLPFAFFGHSMGARIAFELSLSLRRNGLPQPERLFVSGSQAPHLPNRKRLVHDLPPADFKRHLAQLGGTPQELLDNVELMDLLLPTLRADFALWETYRYVSEPPLACPISAYGGTADPHVTHEELLAWGTQTSAAFDLQMLPGDHFFVRSALNELLPDIVTKSISHQKNAMRV